ncbi:MAG: DUF2141 domain-containing protein [Chlorobium sp.]|nr:MAG: DUF2141 domain-containing protein [Chlorobium sp.]
MKQIIFLLLLFCVVFSGKLLADSSSPESGKTLKTGRVLVRVVDVCNHKGDLGIALFNARKGFPGKVEYAFAKGGMSAEGETHVYVFENIPYGIYAVSVMHDENRKGKLETNFLGIPKNGVGASNNPKFRFGPPSFEDASFPLDCSEVEVDVHLKYL